MARRARLGAGLAETGGGTAGLTGLRAIQMESPDPEATARVWRALTGEPKAAAPGVTLRISEAKEIRVAALVFGARNLLEAEASLRSKGVDTSCTGGVLWMNAAAASGLRIGFVAG